MSFRMLRVCALGGLLVTAATLRAAEPAVDFSRDIHDLNATLLHCLGVNHERLTYRFQGRDFRLTDVHGTVVDGLLA